MSVTSTLADVGLKGRTARQWIFDSRANRKLPPFWSFSILVSLMIVSVKRTVAETLGSPQCTISFGLEWRRVGASKTGERHLAYVRTTTHFLGIVQGVRSCQL